MLKIQVSLNELLPVKQAMRALSYFIDDVESGRKPHYVITRRNQPRAVLISIERYEELLEAEGAAARRKLEPDGRQPSRRQNHGK